MTQMPTTQDKKSQNVYGNSRWDKGNPPVQRQSQIPVGQAPGNKTAAIIGEHVAQDGTGHRRNGVKGKEPCRSRGLKFSFFLIIGIIIQGSQGKWKGSFLNFGVKRHIKPETGTETEKLVLCPQMVLFFSYYGGPEREMEAPWRTKAQAA